MNRDPILVVGSGRSGTTLTLNLLSRHPQLAWIPVSVDRFPQLPVLAFLSRPTPLSKTRLLRPSSESKNFLSYCGVTPERLRQGRRSLTAADMTDEVRRRLRSQVDKVTRTMGRSRLVLKSTGNTMRIPYLLAAFPQSQVVHVVRDGRAVAHSLMNVGFWPNQEIWWLGSTPAEWIRANPEASPYTLAARHWKRQLETARQAREALGPAQFFEVRYEKLLADPGCVVKDLLSWAGLDGDVNALSLIMRHRIDSPRAEAWRSEMARSDIAAVEAEAGNLLADLGYNLTGR